MVIALVAAGGTWASLQPIVASQTERLHELTGLATAATRVEVTVALVGLLDLVLSAVLAYLVISILIGGPLQEAERRAGQTLAREGRRLHHDTTPGGSLAQAVAELGEALVAERQTSERRLTELTVNAEQRARLQAELVAADRLATIGKLAAGVAHEVGNPLSGILGYLSVLRMRAEGKQPTLEVLDRIEDEVKRIDGIVRGLLEMGRPSRGKAQPLDVGPLVAGCVKMVTSMRENAQVRIDVACPEGTFLRAEPGPLAQVLVNLLLNGCQATGGKGSLQVRVLASGTSGEIIIEDDGPGIPPDVLPKLFTPFFTTRPPGQGTGLGLAVSRHLLGQFDGKLTAENRAGGGARFTISLPAV
ncbi:MAG: two-component sensor histidine kinase [Myxococcaceae bacterium]|nr:two-component sensor histidine kinase [Myxococcaceae bacterium]